MKTALAVSLLVAFATPAQADPTAAVPRPAAASVHLYLPDAFFVLGRPVTVPHRVIHVTGVLRPFVAGQEVTVRVFLGSRLVKSRHVRIAAVSGGRTGRFSESFASPGAGDLKVLVSHHQTAEMRRLKSSRSLAALGERVTFGSTGRFVVLIQQRLAALHFYIPRTGVYDAGTGMAIDAYHRLLHWGTSQTLDGRTISFLLDGFGAFKVRFPAHGRHAEANLSLQLVALIDGKKVQDIFPASSGKPSTPTVLGDFRVYQRQPGFNQKGMFYSDYFYGNYAIHGYDPVPDYPASHGCVRIPIADAIPAFNWLALGDWVDVYY